eukprot:UN07791
MYGIISGTLSSRSVAYIFVNSIVVGYQHFPWNPGSLGHSIVSGTRSIKIYQNEVHRMPL